MRRYKKRKATTLVKARKKAFNLQYDKELWVKGSTQIKKFRDELLIDALELKELPFGTEGMSQVCLDHNHNNGKCRGCLRSDINLYLGRLELYHRKLFSKTNVDMLTILKYLVEYLEKSEEIESKLHWAVVEVESRRLNRWRLETIHSKLREKGLDLLDVSEYNKHQLVEIWLQEFIKEQTIKEK